MTAITVETKFDSIGRRSLPKGRLLLVGSQVSADYLRQQPRPGWVGYSTAHTCSESVRLLVAPLLLRGDVGVLVLRQLDAHPRTCCAWAQA